MRRWIDRRGRASRVPEREARALDAYLETRSPEAARGVDANIVETVDRAQSVADADYAALRVDETALTRGWQAVIGAAGLDPFAINLDTATNSPVARSPQPQGRLDGRVAHRGSADQWRGRHAMSYVTRAVLAIMVAVLVAGGVPVVRELVNDDPIHLAFQGSDSTPTNSAERSPVIPDSCKVTAPNGYDPQNTFPYEDDLAYGKHGLYTELPEDGVYVARQGAPDNSAANNNKWIWVREAPGGPLDVTFTFHGERTNAFDPTVEILDGYGDVGVQIAIPWFPETGCWTITASTPHATLDVTVWVVVGSWQGTPDVTPRATPAAVIPDSCDVTLPNDVDPNNVGPPGTWFGKDGLYVGVPVDGVYLAKTEPDQPGGWNKHIWVRDAGQGPLTVTVEPIGEHATLEPGRAGPTEGSYVMEIWFPDEGCYQITGSTPQTSITVTVWVVFVDDWLATPAQ